MSDSQPYLGFWQILSDDPAEQVVPYRNTTTAVRAELGFVLYTQSYFMRIHVSKPRIPPEEFPPDEQSQIEMFGGFEASAGTYFAVDLGDSWHLDHGFELASDPRIEGLSLKLDMTLDGDRADVEFHQGEERWRRLSGPGSTPLSGVWQTRSEEDRWLYMTTAGHYAVMRADLDRPLDAPLGADLSDDQVWALASTFGANAGARLETAASFDHWPMIGQVAGYDVRKHETFKIERITKDSFTASLPTFPFPPQEWTRLE